MIIVFPPRPTLILYHHDCTSLHNFPNTKPYGTPRKHNSYDIFWKPYQTITKPRAILV